MSDARCLRCLSDSTKFEVETYILAVIAGLSRDPDELQQAARQFQRLSPQTLLEVRAYLLAVAAGLSTDPNSLIAQSRCYDCIPPGLLLDVETYLLMQDPNGPHITDLNALAQAAKAFLGWAWSALLEIQVYLLAATQGLTTDPEQLALLAKCMKCIPFIELTTVAVQIVDFIEPIPATSPRINIPPPPGTGRPTGNPGHRGGIPGCTDTAANLVPRVTPHYDLSRNITTIDILFPKVCCQPGTYLIYGSNSADMSGAVVVATGATGGAHGQANVTITGLNVAGLGFSYYVVRQVCSGGLPVSGPSNIFASTFLIQDSMETYANGASLQGLNDGIDWSGPYTDRLAYLAVLAFDDLESYADGSAIAGLNGGTGWAGAYAI